MPPTTAPVPSPVAAPPSPSQAMAQARQFWSTRTGRQKLLLGAGAVVTAALLAVFTSLMSTPEYKPLMTDLEPADAQAMTSELLAKQIPSKLSPDGKVLSVPADKLDAARLEVAGHPSTHSGRMGFEIFDKVSWGQTEFDEKVNYQRALEGELERTISSLGGVKSARVHLVMASDSVFLDRERGAKASVTLKLAHGTLSEDESAAIQRLVAGAVEGLKPTDVIITDADSNQSLGATKDGMAAGEGLEKLLTQHLIATLSPVVGAAHLRASVNVEYDQGTSEESLEKYDPSVSVPLSVQRSDEQTGPGAAPSGVPGASSNVPQGKQTAAPQPTSTDTSETSKTENSVFGVNKTVRHSIEPAGRIRRVTAAVLVDDLIEHKQMPPHGKWVDTRMKRSPEQLKQIEELAQAAIGFDAARGDVISVQDMSFTHDAAAVDPPAPSVVDKVRKGVSDYATLIRYGALLVLFVLAYMLMIRPIQKHALAMGQLAASAPPELPNALAPQLLPQPADEVERANVLKQQIAQLVKAEPTSSARAVQAWVRGGNVMSAAVLNLSGPRKAAILIAVLGEESAATIFRNLDEEDLQRVTYEISRLGAVPREVSLQVLEEYHQMTEAQRYIAQGGQELATRMLIKAFGEAGAREMVQRLSRAHELSATRVESLRRIEAKQLARFLEGEHPQTVALILGHLDAKQASALLMCLPQAVRAESVRRLANLRQFSPEMAEKVSMVLNRRLRSVGEQTRKTYSGFQSVADLMNNVDANTSREILELIEKQDQKLAISIRDLMFTFEDFLKVPEVQVREITAVVDKKVLTLALKGASEEIKVHFYQTMSSRAIEMMKEDAESLGPVRGKDVAKAQVDVIAVARKLEAEGKIVLKSDGGDEYVV